MTFSLEVKEEVSVLELSYAEKRAQLSALLKINGALVIRNNNLVLNVRSEISKTAQFIYKAVKEIYGIDVRLLVAKRTTLKKNNCYIVEINRMVKEILVDLEIVDKNNVVVAPTRALLLDTECMKSYLRGCFLASGSINPPTTKYYHLEINLHDNDCADFVVKLLKKFSLSGKILLRRNNFVVYLKKAEEISDFLRLINAHSALLKFEEERITRDFYNSNNRLSICEISNEIKVLEAGKKQSEAVQFLIDHNLLDMLNEKDRYIAMLRLQNPEVSMTELASIYSVNSNTIISKSGINHSIRRIMDLVAKLKKQHNL